MVIASLKFDYFIIAFSSKFRTITSFSCVWTFAFLYSPIISIFVEFTEIISRQIQVKHVGRADSFLKRDRRHSRWTSKPRLNRRIKPSKHTYITSGQLRFSPRDVARHDDWCRTVVNFNNRSKTSARMSVCCHLTTLISRQDSSCIILIWLTPGNFVKGRQRARVNYNVS